MIWVLLCNAIHKEDFDNVVYNYEIMDASIKMTRIQIHVAFAVIKYHFTAIIPSNHLSFLVVSIKDQLSSPYIRYIARMHT